MIDHRKQPQFFNPAYQRHRHVGIKYCKVRGKKKVAQAEGNGGSSSMSRCSHITDCTNFHRKYSCPL